MIRKIADGNVNSYVHERFVMLHFATHTHDVPAFSSPAFSTPAIWSHVFQSCLFHPCDLAPRFPVLRFPVPRFQRPRLVSSDTDFLGNLIIIIIIINRFV